MKQIEDIYELTPIQQGILFHTLYAPASGVYLIQLRCSIHGDLDSVALQRAWQHVIERHPTLRTGFVWERRDKPLQIVFQHVRLPWQALDWRALSAPEQAEQLERWLAADRLAGFELTRAPLLRLALIRMAEDRYEFIWSFHHIVMDGWSYALVLKEVLTCYEAFDRGEAALLPPARPYRDYILWLQQQDVASTEAIWRRVLAGFSRPTPLMVDRRSAPEQAQARRSTKLQIDLPAETSAALRALARRECLTLGTLAQAAWALLLSHYSSETDVLFGVTVSGRPEVLPEVGAMVGLFINTLPLRAQVAPAAALLPWLRRLQDQQAELHQYAHSSLVEIQGWSDVPRGQPLFESILVFENYPVDDVLRREGSGLNIQAVHFVEATNYPLTVVVVPGQTLSLGIMYDCARFDDATIGRMLGHLRTLLEGMPADPERCLADLPLLAPAEQHQLLVEWNDTAISYQLSAISRQEQAEYGCLHELVEAQAALTPDAIAAVCDPTNDQRPTTNEVDAAFSLQVTYSELDRRASGLARQLVERGVRPEDVVGVLAPRGIDLLTALLAIFKAGAVYLPLDPGHPPQRHQQVLDQSRAVAILAAREFVPTLAALGQGPPVLELEGLLRRSPVPDPLPARCSMRNLAYVIYTSGSTGQPKGAMIEHEGMLNHLYAKIADLGLTDRDTVPQTASQCFDISIWQLLAPLLVGGRVCIFPDLLALDPTRPLHEVEREQVTILETVPTLLQAALEQIASAACRPTLRRLRWLISTGESLPPDLCRLWLDSYPRIPMLNAYGPTECSDDVAHYPIYAAPADDQRHVPIGRPVANTQLYILNPQLRPVPISVIGELYVGGRGVGRGYLNRPDLTAEKFIPNPFLKDEGGRRKDESDAFSLPPSSFRLYRTGDLARYRPDGNIEFLGRRDHQVKVRGYRIELGEIEAVLRLHPSLREAVVQARETRPGDVRLVAYVVTSDEFEVTSTTDSSLVTYNSSLAAELRTFLAAHLPAYMIPSAFVPLDALPLTPNGKIDRQVLPEPEGQRPELEATYIAPRSVVEQQIAAVWQEVLQVERVGVHDNFFDLGGHSLHMIRLYSKLRSVLRHDFTLITLFEYPTIRAFAGYLFPEQDEGSSSQAIHERVDQRRALMSQRKDFRQAQRSMRVQQGEEHD